jgi:hypothetical protein
VEVFGTCRFDGRGSEEAEGRGRALCRRVRQSLCVLHLPQRLFVSTPARVLEVFTSLLSLSDRVMVLTIMVALMDSGELIHDPSPFMCIQYC